MELHRSLVCSAAIAVLAVLIAPQDLLAAPAKVCVSNKTGDFKVRKKCRSSETLVSVNSLNSIGLSSAVGPQGPQGPAGPKGATGPKGDTGAPGPARALNLASCYEKNGNLSLFSPAPSSSVSCNDINGQFLHNWSYGASGGAQGIPVISAVDLVLNGNVPVGVQISAKAVAAANPVQVQAFIVCCAR